MAGKLSFLKSQLFNMPESKYTQEIETQTFTQSTKKSNTSNKFIQMPAQKSRPQSPGWLPGSQQPCPKHNSILKLNKTAFYIYKTWYSPSTSNCSIITINSPFCLCGTGKQIFASYKATTQFLRVSTAYYFLRGCTKPPFILHRCEALS